MRSGQEMKDYWKKPQAVTEQKFVIRQQNLKE
jgi:hypothetical protein